VAKTPGATMDSVLARKAVCALLPGSAELHRRLPGGMRFSGPNRPGYGGRGVYVYGAGLEPELELLGLLLRPTDWFVDVGANSGIYTVMAAPHVPHGGIVAVEPNREMWPILKKNIHQNDIVNVHLAGVALSDEKGVAELWHRGNAPNSYSLVASSEQRESSSTVETETLDGLLASLRCGEISLVKLDVEGAESQVLRGASQVLAGSRPTVIAEVTKSSEVAELPGYRRFQRAGSPNVVLVPDERASAAVELASSGWLER
jgi:FkbM family methyltransferase